MLRFRRCVYRERRRLAIFAVLTTLAAFLVYSGDIGQTRGISNAAIAAAATGIGAGLIALGLLLLNPSWRFALESVGISLFLYVVFITRLPGDALRSDAHSLIAFTGFLVLAVLVHHLIYGRWSDRILRLPLAVERTTCLTPLDRDSVWAAVWPKPEMPGAFWDELVETITPRAGDPDALVLFHRLPDGMMMEQEFRMQHVHHGRSLRYFYRRLHAPPRGEQSLAMILEERGHYLALHFRWERRGYPLRRALMHWIDDWGGRAADRRLGRLEDLALSRGSDRRRQAQPV